MSLEGTRFCRRFGRSAPARGCTRNLFKHGRGPSNVISGACGATPRASSSPTLLRELPRFVSACLTDIDNKCQPLAFFSEDTCDPYPSGMLCYG